MFGIGDDIGNTLVRITVKPEIGKTYTVDMLVQGFVEEEVETFVNDNLKFVDHYTYKVIG